MAVRPKAGHMRSGLTWGSEVRESEFRASDPKLLLGIRFRVSLSTSGGGDGGEFLVVGIAAETAAKGEDACFSSCVIVIGALKPSAARRRRCRWDWC